MDILQYQISTCFTRYTELMTILHVCQHRLNIDFTVLQLKCITKHTIAVLKYLF